MLKIALSTITILLVSFNCFGLSFAQKELIDELFIEEEIDHKVFAEEGEYLLIHVDFAPYDYCIGQEYTSSILNYEDRYTYNNRHGISIRYYITVFIPSNIEVRDNEEPAYETKRVYCNLNSELGIEGGQLAIKSLEVYANIGRIDPDYPPPEITVKDISITNLTWVNPEYPDSCQVSFWMKENQFKSGDNIPIYLARGFYYGYESQFIDVYLVYFNYVDLYFFPSMSLEIDKITMFMPQYTMIRYEDILIGEINVDALNPNMGTLNAFAFGIAPEGTANFLNEIYPRTFVYSNEE